MKKKNTAVLATFGATFGATLGATLGAALLASGTAHALDQIVRPYQGARSAGMGGVRYTTGLYDENFFANPARATANPRMRITVIDLMSETSSSAISNIGALTGGSDFYKDLSSTSGSNNHVRAQYVFPGIYFSADEGKMGFGIALITSVQVDAALRRSFQIEPMGIADIGPAITVARKFLENDALSVGLTTHFTYRAGVNQPFTLVDLISGKSLSLNSIGGQGAHFDADIGGTYVLPVEPLAFKITTALAINNLLGGGYSNLATEVISGLPINAPRQPRTFNLGASATKAELGPFKDSVFALEVTDIGNNSGGSLFRTIHLGGEVRYGVLLPRLGFNQGYISAGLGLDLSHFTFDLATYGEEMTLNTGGLQDRRFVMKLAFQI